MNLHYTYLLLNIASIFFPFILSFDKKVAFYKTWKYLFPAIILNGFFFIGWDILFTAKGVWGFNPNFLIGIYLFNLPIEEILFFLTVPYSCVFIYEVFNTYVKRDILGSYGKILSILISIICFIVCLVFSSKTYTIVNAGICLLLLIFTTFIYKFKNLGRFYIAYFVSLIPFLICNGILTGLPVVIYNNYENMNIRLYTIPVEDILYCLSLLLSTILLMDYLKKRQIKE